MEQPTTTFIFLEQVALAALLFLQEVFAGSVFVQVGFIPPLVKLPKTGWIMSKPHITVSIKAAAFFIGVNIVICLPWALPLI